MLFYRNDELLIRCVTKGQKMASNLHKICINLHKNGVIIRSDSTRVVSHKSKGFFVVVIAIFSKWRRKLKKNNCAARSVQNK